MENKSGIDYSKKILQVRNLKKYFKVGTGKTKIKVKAVDDISFDVHKREVFGLVGESGCGKTTASRTIIRLYRPTDGVVTFEDQVIGSGHNEFYKQLKYEKIQYRTDMIKTDSRKKAIIEIKSKFEPDFKVIKYKKETLEAKYKDEKAAVNQEVEDYKITLFREKNAYNLRLEEALYEYTKRRDDLFKKTVNEYEFEYKDIKKSLINGYKSKVEAINYSQGLSKEAKESHKQILTEEHATDLADLDKRLLEKISSKTDELLSKEEFKLGVNKFKESYKKDVEKISLEYKTILENINKPNYELIKTKLADLKVKYKQDLLVLKSEENKVLVRQNEQIRQLPAKGVVDFEKRAQLRTDHKEFVRIQREGIRNSRKSHYQNETESKIREMQMIFQDPISSLNPRMTVGEIISEGLVIQGEKDKELIKKKVLEVLEVVGLAPEYISRYPHEFSGGQRQRIGIARAIIMNPSFIIADEPISALDVSIRAQVLNLLTELKDKLDLSILFIAHDLSVVKFFCDRIAVMYAGKIIEMAPSAEVFSNPLHPYTKSLLSAVPQPDPDSEKLRKRVSYSPAMHDYRTDTPNMHEVSPGHFVYCNEQELSLLKKELGDKNA